MYLPLYILYNMMMNKPSYQSYLHTLDLSNNQLKLLPEGIFQVYKI